MKQSTGRWLAGLAIISMGFGLPAYLAYLAATQNLNIWLVGIFSFFSILGGALIVIVYLGVSSTLFFDDDGEMIDRHKNIVDSLSDLVERMDSIYEALKEIDDVLKMEE
ncbi:MAG: hypothetical protein K9W43_10880 [Candidatus Thorarchaeota archaeon]|nr:hypothetical protein [Candidatus Thorarchaeota archaeon]